MSNPLSQSWVKNVYNMRTLGGIGCGTASPLLSSLYIYLQQNREQVINFSQLAARLHTKLSTVFLSATHLLNSELYLLSTRPTITKTNKILNK